MHFILPHEHHHAIVKTDDFQPDDISTLSKSDMVDRTVFALKKVFL